MMAESRSQTKVWRKQDFKVVISGFNLAYFQELAPHFHRSGVLGKSPGTQRRPIASSFLARFMGPSRKESLPHTVSRQCPSRGEHATEIPDGTRKTLSGNHKDEAQTKHSRQTSAVPRNRSRRLGTARSSFDRGCAVFWSNGEGANLAGAFGKGASGLERACGLHPMSPGFGSDSFLQVCRLPPRNCKRDPAEQGSSRNVPAIGRAGRSVCEVPLRP